MSRSHAGRPFGANLTLAALILGRFLSKDKVSDVRLVHTSHDSGLIQAKFLGARTALFPQRAGVDLSGHCSATIDGRPSEAR